jgi:hypothetical protein
MESQQESSSKFKSLRYGTSLKPIKVQRVCAKFPSRDELSLIDSVKIKQFSRPFAKVKAMVRFRIMRAKSNSINFRVLVTQKIRQHLLKDIHRSQL